jgi:hypothetical protein
VIENVELEVGLDQKGAIRWRSKRLPPIINGVEIEFQIEIDDEISQPVVKSIN